MSENKDLILIDTALQDFDKISAGFALLEKNFRGVLFDCEDPLSLAHAKAARSAIRDPRYEVERLRKGAKAPLLALGKKVDAEATRLTNALLELEEPIQAQIKEFEERQERERLAKAQAELERRTKIEDRIQAIRNSVVAVANSSPETILNALNHIRSLDIETGFDEFQIQVSDARTATLARLSELHTAAVEREAEKVRIANERAELAALRAAQEERDRQARAEQARKDADAQVERDRLAAIAQAERLENERIARESLRLERERIAAEEVEAIRLRGIEQAKQVEAARAHAQELRQAREALEAEAAANRARESERAAAIEAAAEIERKKNAEEAAALVAQRAQFEAEQAEIARQQAEANKPKPSKAQSKVPSKLCADLESHLDAIDAYVFSSDTFETDKARARLRYFMGRWERDFAAKEKVA